MTAGTQVRGWAGPSRRRVPRFQLQAPLDVTVLRSGVPDTVPGRSVNVCERGIAAMMAGELLPGEAVGVEVRLPMAAESLRARAMVRYQDKLRCGLEFVGLSAEQRASIRDWAKDAKALDPEIHSHAVAGIVKAADVAPEPIRDSGKGGAENSSVAPGTDTPGKTARKWGNKTPVSEASSE